MEPQLNIQVTSSDVVTLLVSDQIERLQAEHDELQRQIDQLSTEENKLVRFAIEERNRLAQEKYGADIESVVNGLKKFYKGIKVSYNAYSFDNAEGKKEEERICNSFLYNYIIWNSGYSSKPIGLQNPNQFVPYIEIYQKYNVEDEVEQAKILKIDDVKPIKFNKIYKDNWTKLMNLYNETLKLADRRNEITALLKNKDAIKEKAIAEMTRRLVGRNENLQNDIREIFSTMNGTKLITG